MFFWCCPGLHNLLLLVVIYMQSGSLLVVSRVLLGC